MNTEKKNTRDNYVKFIQYFLEWLKKNKGKTYENLTPEDTKDYKAFCMENYKVNGNVSRLNSVNNFVDEFLGRAELRITAPKSMQVNKPVLSAEELEQYKHHAKTPLERLIVTYQIDGLLRPGEFQNLRISLHDCKNQILYLSDTKTGDNSVILTPNMMVAYNEYLRNRLEPKNPEHRDILIIIDKGSNYGLPILTKRADFIYRQTKKIAMRAGFTRSVYPYLIKPSAITDGFNQQMNPKILQRQARHKNIETTLRYDHISDKMAKEYFNRIQTKQNLENLDTKDKAKVWLEKLLSEEIDLKTFKTGIDVLLLPKCMGDDVGYV